MVSTLVWVFGIRLARWTGEGKARGVKSQVLSSELLQSSIYVR